MIFKSYLLEKNISLINKDIFLFYGENLGLKNNLKTKIKLNEKNTETILLNQEEIIKNKESFFNEIFNISLFEKKKIYFIEQCNDKILDIIKDIEPKLENQKLYLFSELLDKKSKLRSYFEKSKNTGVVACYDDNEVGIKRIIFDKLNGFEGLSAVNINMIVDSCKLDRVRLDNEINKINAFFVNKKLESSKLEKLLDLGINDDFNILKDEALKGNKLQTNKLLGDTIMDDDKNILYLNIINQRLNKLIETYNLSKSTNLENAMSMIKPPIFWKDKPIFLEQAKKWKLNKVKNILKKTYDLEIQIKTNTSINKNILMKKLLVDICSIANA